MGWKTAAILSLLWLAAAAAPPADCLPSVDIEQALPLPLDLAGRPGASVGLSRQTFGTPANSEDGSGCRGPLPSNAQSNTLYQSALSLTHGPIAGAN